jgi:hypothetical protein
MIKLIILIEHLKLNNVKHLFLSNLVRDILFQLIDQYISKKTKRKILFRTNSTKNLL